MRQFFIKSPCQATYRPLRAPVVAARRILAAVLALCMLPLSCALALVGDGYPAPGDTLSADSISGTFGDTPLMLEFDSSSEFSYLENGAICACFFAFNEAEDHYLELYLTLPADVSAGDVLASDDPTCTGVSVYLYEVTADGEVLYCVDQLLGVAFPEGSSYSIRISEAVQSDAALTLRGSIAATLALSGDTAAPQTLSLTDVNFDFTLPLRADAQQPSAASRAPAFTLPPDYALA